jgi:diadenylate cyclase
MMEWYVQFWSEHRPQILGWGSFLLQIVILTGLIYFVYIRFIRKSHAEQLLKGLFIMLLLFVGMWIFASVFHMPMLENIFAASIQILFIGLIVIFQPELRRMLLFLGQGELFASPGAAHYSPEEQKAEFLIQEITETVHFLSKAKRGALIVLESPNSHGGDYLEMGTPLDSKLSTELMLTIFHHNTPLHDGAVVIGPDNRIVAAGVLLPLTEDPKLSWQYGTRHRAAIGLTEISDSRCVVVSEETGAISLVQDGKLEKMANAEELRKALARIYQVSVDKSAEPKPAVGLGEKLTGFLSGEAMPNPIQRIFHGRKPSPPADKFPKSGTGG